MDAKKLEQLSKEARDFMNEIGEIIEKYPSIKRALAFKEGIESPVSVAGVQRDDTFLVLFVAMTPELSEVFKFDGVSIVEDNPQPSAILN